jgi:NAD(P)-dependent dehydrogenase (short-subunit alcohol dehydrogenase family)
VREYWSNVTFDYSGARVLVTGGTSGLGSSIAQAYREAGAEVTITGTRGSAAEYDEDLSGFHFAQLDVENREQIDALAAATPALDILINNAGGILAAQGLDEMEPDVFERAIAIHLLSGQRLAARLRDRLAESKLPGGGSVVGIGSLGSFFGLEVIPGYGPAKTGLLGLTRALAVAWGKHAIRVNTVAAGTTLTRMTAPFIGDPAFSREHLARTPLGRHGVPGDINGAVLFVTSGAAAWLTGQVIAIDGGYTIMG